MPQLSAAGIRALEMHHQLSCLADLGVGGKILELYGATLEDVELLTVVADTQRKEIPDNGDGSEMDAGC